MMKSASAIDPATIRTAIYQARESARQIGDLQAANARTIRTLEAALNEAVKGVVNDPLQCPADLPASLADHRRAHRPGFPARITSDPELEAFIRARIDHMTYAEVVAAVAEAFPPARRVRKSALAQWWKANRDKRA